MQQLQRREALALSSFAEPSSSILAHNPGSPRIEDAAGSPKHCGEQRCVKLGYENLVIAAACLPKLDSARRPLDTPKRVVLLL